jgi:hypothetical protein
MTLWFLLIVSVPVGTQMLSSRSEGLITLSANPRRSFTTSVRPVDKASYSAARTMRVWDQRCKSLWMTMPRRRALFHRINFPSSGKVSTTTPEEAVTRAAAVITLPVIAVSRDASTLNAARLMLAERG